jgi:uncharacterized protein involved in exopolysaccharide biosynthesis
MNETSTTGDAGMIQVIRFFLRNYLLIFVMPFVLGLVIFFATAFMTPIYRAEILLVPAEESGGGSLSTMLSGLGGLGKLAGFSGAGPTRKDEALAMLRSRSFLSAFIESSNGFAVLYPEAWDDEARTWRADKAIPSAQDRYLEFTESVLSIGENAETGIIRVAISLPDRLIAAEWANEIVAMLNEKFRERVAAEAKRSIEYLEGELETASSVELRQVIHRLIESQIQTIMLTNVRKDFVFRVVDPAVAPDADYTVAPRRALLAFAGLVLGGLLGLAFALTRESLSAAREAEATK